jgi:hypothetical protein
MARRKTRTDELAEKGARRLGGGSAPFVKWGEDYGYVEGRIIEMWEGNYGRVATLEVQAVDGDVQAVEGGEEEKITGPIAPGDIVNLGLSYAVLQRAITESLNGRVVHVAFDGWDQNKAGQKFRAFRVFELPDGKPPEAKAASLIDIKEQKRLWRKAQGLDFTGLADGPETAFKLIIAEVKGIDPEDVKLSEITVDEAKEIEKRLDEWGGDLPF